MSDNLDTHLPDGWALGTIGDCIGKEGVFIDGDWVESKDQDPSGDVRLIQLADVGDGVYRDRSSRFLTLERAKELRCTFLEPGDVLIARMPDPLGRACLFPGDERRAVTVVDVCVVRSGSPGVNHRWLSWAINSPVFRNQVASLQSGSTRKRISRGNLAGLRLRIPPEPEQVRIADAIEVHLSRLESGVAGLNRVRANLKHYRASVLKAGCEGQLVPPEAELARREGREYESASTFFERFGVTELAGASNEKFIEPRPEGWAWTRLAELADLQGGITKGQAARPGQRTRTVPYLRVANVQRGYLDLSVVKLIDAPEEKIEALRLLPGDILFNEGGDRDKLGRGWIWSGEIEECIHQNHVFRARLRSKEIDPRFVSWFGNSLGQKYFMDEGKQTTNLASINITKLGALPISLPPIAEQKRIVAEVERRLSTLDKLEVEVAHGLRRAERLRQSILKRAFEGKLVPQDPNDEPARVLLERIRAERASQAPAPRKRRVAAK